MLLIHLSAFILALLSSLPVVFSRPTTRKAYPTTIVATRTTTVASTATGCSVGALRPRATGPPVVAVTTGTSVYNLQVYGSDGGPATLVTSGFHQGWSFSEGGWGALIWSPSCMSYLYLNVNESGYSYKPLTWSWTKITTYWVIADQTDIGTSAASPYGIVTDFLACGGILYLQTGSDVPAGQSCEVTKLRIGAM